MKRPARKKKPQPVQAAPSETPRRRGLIGRIFRRGGMVLRILLSAVLALVCAVVCYVAVILGDSPELEEGLAESAQTTLSAPAALPGGGAVTSQDARALAPYFPGPLAQVASSSGIPLSQGSAADVSVGGVTCRVVTLRYAISGENVTLYSATPAAFLQRYDQGDLALSEDATSLGILSAILATGDGRQVVLARQGDVVYALEVSEGFSGLGSLAAWIVFE